MMVRVVSLLTVLSMLSFSVAFAQDLPCLRCHTQANPLPDKIKKSGAKSASEFLDFLRNKSPKKALHKAMSDEDIRKAFEQYGKK